VLTETMNRRRAGGIIAALVGFVVALALQDGRAGSGGGRVALLAGLGWLAILTHRLSKGKNR
jgi:hypothetical protein